ncbi:MAG: triose-phosphate isomerase [Gammaproteobacteria bacterium]|nr:triose-phosphate isomerase [Gammaproteobacteria bacterium]
MNGTRESVLKLLYSLQAGISTVPRTIQVVVLPSFVYLEETERRLKSTSIAWGAQNVHAADSGAFTGEVSAPMLRAFGCTYVLVGHSERRRYNQGSGEGIAEKFQAAIRAELRPILCVGETCEERQAGETLPIIYKQLDEVLGKVGIASFEKAVIAYEPVWAIGTGLAAAPQPVGAVITAIRDFLSKKDKTIAEKVGLLYGGSITRHEASELFKLPQVDGGLVGGASLNAAEFLDIARSF